MTEDTYFAKDGTVLVPINDFAVDPAAQAALRKPFPAHLVSRLQKGSRTEDYVSHAAVVDRLNSVVPGWTMGKPDFIIDGDGHISGVLCSMTIGSVTRWEIGDVDLRSKPGAEAKLAMSDWIKRAAMRFGVGIDLWSKEDLTVSPGDSVVSSPDVAGPTGDAGGGPTAATPSVAAPADSPAPMSRAAGVESDSEVTVALGEGASSADGSDSTTPATGLQWQRLVEDCKGDWVKAIKRVNHAAQQKWTKAEAQQLATKSQLAAAILGEVA